MKTDDGEFLCVTCESEIVERDGDECIYCRIRYGEDNDDYFGDDEDEDDDR